MNTSTTSLSAPIEQTVVLRSLDEDGSASGWSLLFATGIVLAISTRSTGAVPRPAVTAPHTSRPRSGLGAALRARREAIVRSGAQTLDWDGIEREIGDRGGEARAD
ncbi:MAG: hypothetical protein HUU15_15270 [Candidatus Brocadiae bacterium]|nr:hypothetical protein [Candidatus Brocadiia bacterium]